MFGNCARWVGLYRLSYSVRAKKTPERRMGGGGGGGGGVCVCGDGEMGGGGGGG